MGTGRVLHALIIIIAVPFSLHGQVLSGRVLDRENGEAVPFADVYFSGSQRGTSANESGYFTIDASGYMGRPLTVSAIGYFSYTARDYSPGVPVEVSLVPKVYEIEGVDVERKALTRKRKQCLWFFRREFLGTTRNGRNCVIHNEEDILFDYSGDMDTIRAFAMKPVRIHNQALGYQITYYLDHFEYNKDDEFVFFTGSIIFSDDETTLSQVADKRRWRAYRGSRMHFIRALWANELEEQHFTVKFLMSDLEFEDLVLVTGDQQRFLKYHRPLSVYYFTAWSSLRFLKNSVMIDKDGYFDPDGLQWGGEMSRQRIGDWLPYEYRPDL